LLFGGIQRIRGANDGWLGRFKFSAASGEVGHIEAHIGRWRYGYLTTTTDARSVVGNRNGRDAGGFGRPRNRRECNHKVHFVGKNGYQNWSVVVVNIDVFDFVRCNGNSTFLYSKLGIANYDGIDRYEQRSTRGDRLKVTNELVGRDHFAFGGLGGELYVCW
jgi:hypothetical protein